MKVSWLKTLKRLTKEVVDDVDEHFRHRLRALQGIDEMVEDVVNLLEKQGVLDDTYGACHFPSALIFHELQPTDIISGIGSYLHN
jgi:hypothetical protein